MPPCINVVPFPRHLPPPRRIEVRISILDGRCPYGHAGPFRITEEGLRQLIDHAARLELLQ